MSNFKKIIRPGGTGKVTAANPEPRPVTCEISFTNGNLSITGEHYGGGGQIEMGFAHLTPGFNDPRYSVHERLTWFCPGWDDQMWRQFLDYWHIWHLNDMRAGCEHQMEYLRQHPETCHRTVEIRRYWGGDKYDELVRTRCGSKDLDAVKEDVAKRETKNVMWTYPTEHEDGWLCRPCKVCGYKYGSEWRRQEVPPSVIAFLRGLPDA